MDAPVRSARWLLLLVALTGAVFAAGCAVDDAGPIAGASATTAPSPTTADPSTTTPDGAPGRPSTSTTTTSTTPTTTTTTSTTTTTTLPTLVATPSTSVDAPTDPLDAPLAPCRRPGGRWSVFPPSDLAVPTPSDAWRREVFGASGRGRDLAAWSRAVPDPERTVLVVGGIHGNEPIGPPLVGTLVDIVPPPGVEVWLVPDLNPDGSSQGIRCNAAGVDLNRNFPWDWDDLDGGPAPLSEPESLAITDLIRSVDPDVVVWVHASLGYVSTVGEVTPPEWGEAWAGASGLPARSDITQHGGSETWTALVAGVPSVLVEVDGDDVTPAVVAAHVAGYAAFLDAVAP